MEFKSQEMITGLERPDISPAMGAEKYSLLWWRPFPGLLGGTLPRFQVSSSSIKDPSQVLRFWVMIPPKAELIANLAGDDIWRKRWWLVRLPPTGINNSSLRISVIKLTFKSVSHQLVTILLLTEILKVPFINNTVVHRYSICVLGKVLLLDQIGTDKRKIQPENY